MTTATLAYESTSETDVRYRHYRPRILFWSIVGYAVFYFVRKNLPIAMPVMEQKLGITKASLGLFLTLHGVLYGISKFVHGFVGDRVNARIFMAIGLLLSAAMNIFFGLSSAVITLGIFWMLNGWFQGMGFPPCARLLTHWFSPKELATKMSIWNTSHGLGAAAILVLCGYLVEYNWRLCFFVPSAIAIAVAGLLLIYLRDTPESVGLPPVAGTETVEGPDEPAILRKVFGNRYIWTFALANFFVYTIRYAVLDWAPTMLKESKGVTLAHAGWITAGFEIAGTIGALCAGWLTDRFFAGRCARVSVVSMILCGGAIFFFWRIPKGHTLLSGVILMASGFFVYGPQAMVGIAAANLATKRCAATAVGLTGIFGYASTVLSGWGLGLLVQRYDWDHAFGLLLIVAGIATVCFLAAWSAPRDGYAAS